MSTKKENNKIAKRMVRRMEKESIRKGDGVTHSKMLGACSRRFYGCGAADTDGYDYRNRDAA